jgi:hypothetical protein
MQCSELADIQRDAGGTETHSLLLELEASQGVIVEPALPKPER